MHIVKLFTLILLLFHTLMPVQNLHLYAGISVVLTLTVIRSGGMPPAMLLFKNIPILSFTIVFFIFMFFPAMTLTVDNFLTVFKIILVFNISIAASGWLGRDGFLFCLKCVPVRRIKLFLLLLSRSLGTFGRNVKAATRGAQLRIELTGRQKLLIPRYYVRSLIMKELYSFYHNQAALVSRLHGDNIAIYTRNGFTVKDLLPVCITICVALAGIFIQAGNIRI
ncbi:MAG: hypothetical protein FWG92_06060 [Leptospirales bacterium]|nr:hypothetical protein [Leptospirales bacterium]